MSTDNGYVRAVTGNGQPPGGDPREQARLRAKRTLKAGKPGKRPEQVRVLDIIGSERSAPTGERRRALISLGVIAAVAVLALVWALASAPSSTSKGTARNESLTYVCYDHVTGQRHGKVELEVACEKGAGFCAADPLNVLARCDAVYGMGLDRAGFELETWVKLLKDANRYPPGRVYR